MVRKYYPEQGAFREFPGDIAEKRLWIPLCSGLLATVRRKMLDQSAGSTHNRNLTLSAVHP